MAEPAPWTCPTCKTGVLTPFCPLCGEEPLKPIDLTLRGIAEKLSHAFTSIDARVLRTARRLLLYPGDLTLAWTEGRRKPYVAPFQLFLVANVIFFFLQSLTGINVFSSSLHSHLHQQDWSELAQALLSNRLEVTRTSIDTYTPIFDRAVVLNAKSLIVLMTVPFSALLPLIFFRKGKPLMLHIVFSLHLYTFLLLVFCLALLAAKACEWSGLGGLDTPVVDNVLSVANLAACALYLYASIGRVYGAKGGVRVLQAVILALAVGVIALGYRFALFLITLYGI
ncbi:Protein of unknown function [Variovorax sp. YR216]|nr:Protein of unknown function [Variovorax sp. YR216]